MALTVLKREVKLAHYFPNTVAPSKEFKVLDYILNKEFDSVWSALWSVFANTFVYDIDEVGAARWEKMLNIRNTPGTPLEERRNRILLKINATLPYTHRRFVEILDSIYGKDSVQVSLNYNEYSMKLELKAEIYYANQAIAKFTRVIVPANIGVALVTKFNLETELYVTGAVVTHDTIGVNQETVHDTEVVVNSGITGAVISYEAATIDQRIIEDSNVDFPVRIGGCVSSHVVVVIPQRVNIFAETALASDVLTHQRIEIPQRVNIFAETALASDVLTHQRIEVPQRVNIFAETALTTEVLTHRRYEISQKEGLNI